MAEEYFINDVRADDDPSFSIVPRVTSFAELQQYFGLQVERQFGWDITPVGKACWKVIGFEVRTGIAAYIPQVKRVDGSPYPQILAIRWWPDVDKYDQPIKPHYRPQNLKWDGGFTDANGVIGMAYGGGSIGGPAGGPDVIWISASPEGLEPQYSDGVSGLGWIGGTNHLNPNPIFQYVVKTNGPTPPTGDYYLDVVIGGQSVGRVLLVTGSTGQDAIWLIGPDGAKIGYANIVK